MEILSENAIKPGFFVLLGEISGKPGASGDYFLKNKANLPDGQIDAISAIAMVYGDFGGCRQRKNKANSKPISKQLKSLDSAGTLIL